MTFSLMQILFGILFGTWLVLTVLFQFPSLQKVLRTRDYLYMLPSWSFFAPVPSTCDFLVFRRFEYKGEITPWKELSLISLPQIQILWDPERRQRKALSDVSMAIAEFIKLASLDRVHLATPYLMLLQVASVQPEALFANSVQIMICVRPAGQKNYELSFQSHTHSLQAAEAYL